MASSGCFNPCCRGSLSLTWTPPRRSASMRRRGWPPDLAQEPLAQAASAQGPRDLEPTRPGHPVPTCLWPDVSGCRSRLRSTTARYYNGRDPTLEVKPKWGRGDHRCPRSPVELHVALSHGPVCGDPTSGAERLPVTLHPRWASGLSLVLGVCIHRVCFERGPDDDELP
jgi:hypothetical protein